MKKKILLFLIYIIMSSLTYYIFPEASEIYDTINIFGIGVFGASVLINLMEKFSNRLIESGRLSGVKKLEKTKYTIFIFYFGIASIVLLLIKFIIFL